MLTALMVLMVVFSNAAGDVFLTKGMKQVGDVSALSRLEILQTIKRMVGNLNFVLGVVCLAVSFFSFLTVLSWADLSFVVPATAICVCGNGPGGKILSGGTNRPDALGRDPSGLPWRSARLPSSNTRPCPCRVS